ncbi:CBS domain-containing protein [Nitrospira sp. MA-1]|nr:CBS domain-containing protein [Nitrospira sp. MA-1]
MDQSQPHFTTVGQLIHTNPLRFGATTTCMEVAIALLSSQLSGGPVLDETGAYLGFVSEFDLLKALDHSQDLRTVIVQQVMSTEPYLIHNDTTIKEAIRNMKEKKLLNLCVEENGVVTKTYTRHDLLRGYLGVDLGIDEE